MSMCSTECIAIGNDFIYACIAIVRESTVILLILILVIILILGDSRVVIIRQQLIDMRESSESFEFELSIVA